MSVYRIKEVEEGGVGERRREGKRSKGSGGGGKVRREGRGEEEERGRGRRSGMRAGRVSFIAMWMHHPNI